MTDQEIARALEQMIREDGQRPPEEQVRDLIEAGVIDAQGRVLIGRSKNKGQVLKADSQNGPRNVPGDEMGRAWDNDREGCF